MIDICRDTTDTQTTERGETSDNETHEHQTGKAAKVKMDPIFVFNSRSCFSVVYGAFLRRRIASFVKGPQALHKRKSFVSYSHVSRLEHKEEGNDTHSFHVLSEPR
jgi:hypothetical protein